MSEDKVIVKTLCINELSYPLPRPINIGKIESRLYIWNTMMAMRSEWQKDYDELQKYKAIEEELGIDLITLFKSVLNGFYVKDGNGITFVHKTDVKEKLMFFKESLFKDYGKTWALTKEELL